MPTKQIRTCRQSETTRPARPAPGRHGPSTPYDRPMSTSRIERERKWLVGRVPDDLPAGTALRQGYLALDGEVELRVRADGDDHVLTVKAGRPPARVEIERALDADEFEALWPSTDGRRIEKTRYRLDVGDLVAELDVYEGDLDGLVTVEVEFPDDEALEAFEAPDWFGDDVTGHGGYGNASLAVHGRPAG